MRYKGEKCIYFRFSHKRQVFLHGETKMLLKRQIQAIKGKWEKKENLRKKLKY